MNFRWESYFKVSSNLDRVIWNFAIDCLLCGCYVVAMWLLCAQWFMNELPQVRKAAQALLPYMMAHVGYSQMVEKIGSVEAKNKKTVQV